MSHPSASTGQLKVKFGKREGALMFCHGAGTSKSDAWLLNSLLNGKQLNAPFGISLMLHTDGHMGPSLLEELDQRGYDVDTLEISIRKKDGQPDEPEIKAPAIMRGDRIRNGDMEAIVLSSSVPGGDLCVRNAQGAERYVKASDCELVPLAPYTPEADDFEAWLHMQSNVTQSWPFEVLVRTWNLDFEWHDNPRESYPSKA